VAGVVLLIGIAGPAFAHAVLVESNPAPDSTVTGPTVAITLKFNVRIDAARSRLELELPNGASLRLPVTSGASSNVLSAQATDLVAGKYKLLWQVLATDGHITRGEVTFSAR
jgi:hypothetical protein